jgi:hypothetical protein
MVTGRPTEYKEEYVQEVLDYIETCSKDQGKLPKRVDIALLLHCHKETLIEWGKIHPDFSDALMRVDQNQESRLIDDGIYGGKEVNPPVIKMLLGNHGYSDASKSDITSGGEPIKTNTIVLTNFKSDEPTSK